MSRQVLLAALGATVLVATLAPTASAAATVNILDLPAAAPAPIGPNGTATLAFNVNIVADGFGCPTGGTFTIPLALNAASLPAGVTAALDVESVDIAVPQGLYQSSPLEPAGAPVRSFNGSAPASIRLTGGNITANGTGSVTVTAAFAGGAPAGCQASPAGGPPASEGTGTASVSAAAPPPPPPPPPPPEDKSFLPAPGAPAVALALVLALALTRLRRRG